MSFSEEREKYLLAIIDGMLASHEEWVSENETNTLDESSPLWQQVDEAIEMFSQGSIPGNLRRIADIVDRDLRQGWTTFLSRREQSLDPLRELPGNGLWKAIETIRSARPGADPLVPRKLESVPDLIAQKVTIAQIARIYNWLTPSGGPDVDKVREEIAEPGKHTSKWVDPRIAKSQEEQQRQKDRIAQLNQRQKAKLSAATKPAKETIETLIIQGLSATQISRMHHCTVDAVWAEADRLKLGRPPRHYTDARNSLAPSDHEPSEATDRIKKATTDNAAKKRGRPKKSQTPATTADDTEADGDEPTAESDAADDDNGEANSVESQISAAYQGGMTIAEIAGGMGMDIETVTDILDRLETAAAE